MNNRALHSFSYSWLACLTFNLDARSIVNKINLTDWLLLISYPHDWVSIQWFKFYVNLKVVGRNCKFSVFFIASALLHCDTTDLNSSKLTIYSPILISFRIA